MKPIWGKLYRWWKMVKNASSQKPPQKRRNRKSSNSNLKTFVRKPIWITLNSWKRFKQGIHRLGECRNQSSKLKSKLWPSGRNPIQIHLDFSTWRRLNRPKQRAKSWTLTFQRTSVTRLRSASSNGWTWNRHLTTKGVIGWSHWLKVNRSYTTTYRRRRRNRAMAHLSKSATHWMNENRTAIKTNSIKVRVQKVLNWIELVKIQKRSESINVSNMCNWIILARINWYKLNKIRANDIVYEKVWNTTRDPGITTWSN